MERDLEPVFALSIIASCLPFISVFVFLANSVEQHNFFGLFLTFAEGSMIGSVFGIISLIMNRKRKSMKIYVLSLFPIIMFLISIIIDLSYKMP